MAKITVEKNPDPERLKHMGVAEWPIWAKEISEFPWSYDETETCYLLAGEVEVTPENGPPVTFGAGDLVTFPRGLSCKWKITKDVTKRYRFG